MSLYKIRESTMTVGGSFTPDSGKIFLRCWAQVLLLIIEGCFVKKDCPYPSFWRKKFSGSLCFMPYQTILQHAIHKSHDQLQLSGLWKVCYFDLSIEIRLFYYKEDASFEDSKKQKRIFSFSLTECLLCSPCWRLANMNRQVYPFIPSSYPMWLLGLSPNEALCKTSKDKKEGEWTHLHRAYERFNIWLIVFLYLWHIF